MKTPNFSISIIALSFILSCINTTHEAPGVYVEHCLNGGKTVSTGLGSVCNCPEGFCGDYCEDPLERNLWGNYEGIMVCQGDSVATQFKVEEYWCPYDKTELLFNDGELTADYWRVWENYEHPEETLLPHNVGEISVNYIGDVHQHPVNGRLTPDSLSFWVLEYKNSPDTCFYVGVRI